MVTRAHGLAAFPSRPAKRCTGAGRPIPDRFTSAPASGAATRGLRSSAAATFRTVRPIAWPPSASSSTSPIASANSAHTVSRVASTTGGSPAGPNTPTQSGMPMKAVLA